MSGNEVTGLVTVVDLDDRLAVTTAAVAESDDSPCGVEAEPGVAPPAPRGLAAHVGGGGHMSLSALHQAVLRDGRCITLLDDRGWSLGGPPEIRRHVSMQQIKADARTVVGPDEESPETGDQVRAHWTHLADVLHRHGIEIDATALARLPHKVELSDRLRACYASP